MSWQNYRVSELTQIWSSIQSLNLVFDLISMSQFIMTIWQMKCAYFKSQMHKLSEALKSIWCFAKWAKIESQLSKKLSQFSSLKWSDIDYMTTTFEKKIEILQEKFFFSSSQANVNDIAESFISLTVSFNSCITEDEVKQTIRWVKADKALSASDILNRAL